MKNYRIIFGFFFSVIMFGCSEEFLETQPTELISADRVAQISEINPALQASNLQGVYTNMYATGTGGTTGHDDYGQKGFDVFTDMLSGDMVLASKIYGWYSGVSEYLVTVDFTSNRTYTPWRYYYRIINGANIVIDGLGGTDAVPEKVEGKRIMGQAKGLRAYAYFYLAQLYVEEYNPSTPILPIYTNTTDPNQPKSPAKDVYALIESDLKDAITLLDGFERSGVFEIDTYVAKGLLAYTYAAQGRDGEAATLSKDIIDNSGYVIMPKSEVRNGFNDVYQNADSWMWGVDLTLESGLDLISWWGQVDIFTYSYAYVGDQKVINEDLWNSIPADDIRKSQFVPFPDTKVLVPANKFYAPARVQGGQRSITTDYLYMRVSEFYLLHAESAAKSGNDAAAQASLKALVEKRVDDASYINGLTGQALIDEAILQGRYELWGEGKSFLSVKRNKRTITTGSNHLTMPGTEIPYNDDRMTFDIPQSEIQNNPEID